MEKTNFKKYSIIHNEIINRLEAGTIPIGNAKEVIDLAFDKYITENVASPIKKTFLFDNSKKDTSNLGVKAYRLLCDLDDLEIEHNKSKRGNSDDEEKLNNEYIQKQKQIWKKIEALPQKEYDAGKKMYYNRFHRNRLRNR